MRLKNKLAIFSILAACFVGYGNSLTNGFVLDDRLVIVSNGKVTAFKVGEILSRPAWLALKDDKGWRPLSTLSFALDWKWHGSEAFWPRFENIVLHAGVCVLILMLALELGFSPWAGLFAALLFALHPIHTEVLNPIVGRSDLLAALLGLLTVLGFLRESFPATLLPFVLGLFAKESILALGFFFPLIIHWRTSRGCDRGKRLTLLAALGGVFILYMILRRQVTGIWLPGSGDTSFLDNPLIAAGALRRVSNAVFVLFRYGLLLLVPWPLSSDYSYDAIAVLPALSARNVAAAGALVLAGFGLWQWALKDKRVGFAAAFFSATLFLVSNIPFPIGTIMGERLLYLPSVSFCLLAALGLERAPRRARAVAATVILSGYGVLCWNRNRDWADDSSVFLAALRSSPGSIKAMTNAGYAYLALGRPKEARRELLRAVAKDGRYALTHSTLALAYRKLGEPAKAEAELKTALSFEPEFMDCWVNLGIIYGETGRLDASLDAFGKALALEPDNAEVHSNMGVTYKRRGMQALASGRKSQAADDFSRALAQYQRALDLNPGYQQAIKNLEALRAVMTIR